MPFFETAVYYLPIFILNKTYHFYSLTSGHMKMNRNFNKTRIQKHKHIRQFLKCTKTVINTFHCPEDVTGMKSLMNILYMHCI